MRNICISRGSYSQGKELAEVLARKLGCECLSREDLVEEATKAGIAVGKLETAMLKPGSFNERLLLEKEHYHAFVTARLCERMLGSDLVYHGRTGHLLLPGVSHVLRIRVVESLDGRINSAMAKLRIPREKARRYLESVDDDMRRWVRTFYDVDWETAGHYDLVVNLEQMSTGNASAALCSVAALPDFETTPASRQAMENLLLAAQVRLELARDERTRDSSFRVLAERGVVLVTYQPRDARVAEFVPTVVHRVPGISELRCTMASTSILWIQEEFDAAAESYRQVVQLARRWNAAVELLRFVPGGTEEVGPATAPAGAAATAPRSREYNGGIEDDVEHPAEGEDGGLRRTQDSLAGDGVAGGAHVACCRPDRLLDKLDSRVKYTLVVVGNVFLQSGEAARVRKTRELTSTLSDILKAPVVGADELKKTYMFSPGQAVKQILYLALVAAVFVLVFTHQETVVKLLHSEGTRAKLLAALGVGVLVPCFAYLYGTVTKFLLKLIRIE
jgi:cytidylate kinase